MPNTTAPRRKKLIEVALPLEAINLASAREKSIRHGHPSTLHLWWARRPLAACRAVLFASLVDDPDSDPAYRDDPDGAAAQRARLFNLIEQLVLWENSNNPAVINAARAEIAASVASRLIELGELEANTPVAELAPRAAAEPPPIEIEDTTPDAIRRLSGTATKPKPKRKRKAEPAATQTLARHVRARQARPEAVNHFLATHAPPVLDPFAGGGSIPLEAQRLGLRAHASDLNPVPVLINKALIEIPPKFANQAPVHPEVNQRTGWSGAAGLAEDVRRYGQWMRDQAEQRIGHLYPKVKITAEMASDRPDLKPYVGEELTVIAWLWARTVPSPDPALGGKHVPLIRSFWLSKKKGKEAYVQPVIDKDKGDYTFTVRTGKPTGGFDPDRATVIRTGGNCLITGEPVTFDHIRTEGKADRMGQRLMAIVCEGQRGRVYLDPIHVQEQTALNVQAADYPITDLPKQALSFRVQLYGMDQHWKLFTARQLTALVTFSDLVGEARAKAHADATAAQHPNPNQYADAIATYLAFVLSKSSNYWSNLCAWATQTQKMISTFGRQALPMVWDFAEANPFSDSTGNYISGVSLTSKMIDSCPVGSLQGAVRQSSAVEDQGYSGEIISTDPPYYDNIGYSDLSDFFYVWLRRSLREVYPDMLSTMLTPKSDELIASPYRHGGSKAKAAAFFETGLGSAIGQWRRHGHADYPTTIFYAFKQAETDTAGTASTGWETFLAGVIDHGFAITATWPMRTELIGNLKKNVSALASSIVLACVPRDSGAAMATRKEFAEALRGELPEAVRHLQSGNVAPVDLSQASIGPGMAAFSRYSKVVNADGTAMTVREALQLINQVLDEALAEQEGDFDAETRWALKWFEQYGMKEGPFGDAETLAKAMAVSVSGVVEAGLAHGRAGKVRLLGRDELDAGWDPQADPRLAVWEVVQHLIRALEGGGEAAAASLLARLGSGPGEVARELAYRLYQLCERKKWADEARAYNGLVVSWPEVVKLSKAAKPASKGEQGEMFG